MQMNTTHGLDNALKISLITAINLIRRDKKTIKLPTFEALSAVAKAKDVLSLTRVENSKGKLSKAV